MSLAAQHKEKLQALERLQAEIQALEASEDFKQEQAFESALRALMSEYSMSAKQTLEVLSPAPVEAAAAPTKRTRKQSQKRVLVNPHTGEKVKMLTRRNQTYKAWCLQYGTDTVETWFE